MSEKKTAHLEDWSFVFPSNMPIGHLSGKVYGHYKIEDGHEVISSPILRIDFDENTAETHNTLYTLGKPDPEWIEWCDKNEVDRSHIKHKRSLN